MPAPTRAPRPASPRDQPPSLTWSVQIRHELRQRDTRFLLDIAFESPARRLALFGPSGAGKSQTLRCMAGLSRPDSARVWLDGDWLDDTGRGLRLPPGRRRLGYVAQDYALFPHLTVRQNVAFGLHAGPFNPPTRRGQDPLSALVDGWLQRMGLDAAADLRPHQLSGGQRQRTALARALVAQPRAILFDEPFAALDRPLQRQLRSDLLELQARLDIPMMLITHDEDDLLAFDGDVIEISAGRVTGHLHPAAGPT